MNKRTLRGATVVVTGATSGIGRATALTFARHGARLVLAARRANVLQDVAAECERQGAQAALPVPTDVTDADAVRRLAQAAADFGGDIDVWVNNAGSGAVGPFEKVPLAAHEQVLRLNLLGYLYGAYHALPHFKRQPAGGTLINVVSLGSWLPEPYTASYSASKYGLRGLFDTLRMELSAEPNIHVCDVHPAYIDTPGFQHGANYTGRLIKPAPPVFPAQQVADAIVRLALHPRASTMVGWTAPVMRWIYALAPGATNWGFMKFMRGYLAQADPAPVSENSLFEPRPAPHGTGISGGWRKPSSAAGSSGWLLGAALAAGAAGLCAWRRKAN